MPQRSRARNLKAFADRLGSVALVLLLVVAILTGPAWTVVAFVLVVPVAAVIWEIAWAGRSETDQPPPPHRSNE